jgi:pilus assembly protein Flp/PilA
LTPFLAAESTFAGKMLLVRPSYWLAARLGRHTHGTKESEKGGSYMLTFLREDEGQGLVEYALIIAVIAIAVIVAMVFLRGQIQNIFSNIGNNLT